MRRTVTLMFLCYFCVRDYVTSVRLLELRAPAHAAEEGEALLGCQFEMEDDILYSVKWYKDSREFYRYVPRNEPPAIYFTAPGITVDMARSSSEMVTLVNLTQESAGLYRCEVSGETPTFTTVFQEKYISVHLLPKSGPRILGMQEQYQVGDRAVLNCTSSASRPETQLKWWINDRLAPREYLQGPWYRVAVDRPDATETILQLRFKVRPKHFKNGQLKLKCQAMIAPMYQKESTHCLSQDEPPLTEPSFYEERENALNNPYERFDRLPSFVISPSKELSPLYESMAEDSATRSNISLLVTSILYLFMQLLLL